MKHLKYTYPILFTIALLAASCGKTRIDYSNKGEFRYYNRTAGPIAITIRHGIERGPFEYHTIAVGDSLILLTNTIGPKVADPTKYTPGITADTTTIEFNDTLCYSEYDYHGPVLHNISTHTFKKRGDADYIFYFTIDSSLQNKAKKCL